MIKKFVVLPIFLLLVQSTGFSQLQNFAIVANGLNNPGSLSIVDLDQPDQKQAVQKNALSLGSSPNDIQTRAHLAYVVNTYSDNVQVIDLREMTTIAEISTGPGSLPEKIAFVDDSRAYVTCNSTDDVAVIDLRLNAVVKRIAVGSKPWGVTMIDRKAYIANSAAVTDWNTMITTYGESSVSVIDTQIDEVIETIAVPINATEIANDGDQKVLVVCTGDYAITLGQLAVINSENDQVEKIIKLKTTPGLIVVNPKKKIAIVNTFSGALIVDLQKLKLQNDKNDLIAEFAGGFGMTIDVEREIVYVTIPDWTSGGFDRLKLIDKNYQTVKIFEVGAGASFVGLAQFDPNQTISVHPADRHLTLWSDVKN